MTDVVEFANRLRWRWAGHVARMNDNRWTVRLNEWRPRTGKRSSGRPARRWRDDIQEYAREVANADVWSRAAKDRKLWKGLEEGFARRWAA